MIDPRLARFADQLVGYSCELKPGERVLIEATGSLTPFVTALVASAYRAGAQPFVWLREPAVTRALLLGAEKEQIAVWAENDAALMAKMDAYIGVRSGDNTYEMSDVPDGKTALHAREYGAPVHLRTRVPKTRWVVLRYPAPSMAQAAGMSTESFEDFYFDVCCMDYAKMSRAMDRLVERMQRTDRVRLLGPGTDLSFSIRGIPAIKCDGKMNIPDGEVFTAPVRDSLNGVIQYNAPALDQGFTYQNIRFVFRDGRIVEATANDTARVNRKLDTDQGARYVGEFAIGVNPFVTRPMQDTLFDEKIAGSIHLTPGACYDEAPNGNQSAVHWDLVLIQTPEWGGGEIWFDGELVRKDGLFVPEELRCLNPDNLAAKP